MQTTTNRVAALATKLCKAIESEANRSWSAAALSELATTPCYTPDEVDAAIVYAVKLRWLIERGGRFRIGEGWRPYRNLACRSVHRRADPQASQSNYR